MREEAGVCRERKGLEESKGKFTNKGVKQKEAENKTKQSPDSSPNSMLFIQLLSPLLLFRIVVVLPSFSLHLPSLSIEGRYMPCPGHLPQGNRDERRWSL